MFQAPRDLVVVPEKVNPVQLVLVAKKGTAFDGKTKMLNHQMLIDGVMKIICRPDERPGLIKYFGRCYQLFEGVPKHEPVEISPVAIEHKDPEVPGDIPRPRGRPRKNQPADE